MILRAAICATVVAASVSLARAQGPPPVPVLTESPWNGDGGLSQTRNTAEIKAAAAEGYRFHLEPARRTARRLRPDQPWARARPISAGGQ
jgi:hypothetical protein